jgi:hypothetical protein
MTGTICLSAFNCTIVTYQAAHIIYGSLCSRHHRSAALLLLLLQQQMPGGNTLAGRYLLYIYYLYSAIIFHFGFDPKLKLQNCRKQCINLLLFIDEYFLTCARAIRHHKIDM